MVDNTNSYLITRHSPLATILIVTRHLSLITAFTTLLLAFGFTQFTSAQDWNQWRGPTRDGLVPASSAPTSWPESYRTAWHIEIGEGYSSPVVSDGRVYIHFRRDPDEIIMAVDPADGDKVWEQTYPAVFEKNKFAARMAKGPFATPLVMGSRLFTLGAGGIFAAWDAKTGQPLWKKDLSGLVDTSRLFCGTAASPLAVGGLIIVQVGSDVHGGHIMALDPSTGDPKWEWRGPGPGYASPIAIEVKNQTQIVTLTNQSVIGLEAKNGKELWTIPFPDQYYENIVTPVWTGSHLIISGIRRNTNAYTLQQEGGKWQAVLAWENPNVTMYMSSPVYDEGVIYGHSNKKSGQFITLDAKTGALRWASEGRDGEFAAVLLTPHHVVFLTNEGELVAARRGTESFEVERRCRVSEAAVWTMPVLLGSDIVLRDTTALMRLTPKK